MFRSVLELAWSVQDPITAGVSIPYFLFFADYGYRESWCTGK